ncbi:MAG: hypothetical protein Q9160_004674 [Pyrenula sp. 1 TL-2023]
MDGNTLEQQDLREDGRQCLRLSQITVGESKRSFPDATSNVYAPKVNSSSLSATSPKRLKSRLPHDHFLQSLTLHSLTPHYCQLTSLLSAVPGGLQWLVTPPSPPSECVALASSPHIDRFLPSPDFQLLNQNKFPASQTLDDETLAKIEKRGLGEDKLRANRKSCEQLLQRVQMQHRGNVFDRVKHRDTTWEYQVRSSIEDCSILSHRAYHLPNLSKAPVDKTFMAPTTEHMLRRSPKRKKSRKRSVTPSRTLYGDYSQAYIRITSGATTGGTLDLEKMPSPPPGQQVMSNPFQNLNPTCKDLPKIPHYMARPGPLSPNAAEQIFNPATEAGAVQEGETERPTSALLPPPIAEVTPPPSMRNADPFPTFCSAFQAVPTVLYSPSVCREGSTVTPSPLVRWDRPCTETCLSETEDDSFARTPATITLMPLAHFQHLNDVQSQCRTAACSQLGLSPAEPLSSMPQQVPIHRISSDVYAAEPHENEDDTRASQTNETHDSEALSYNLPIEVQKALDDQVIDNGALGLARNSTGFFRDLSQAEMNILQKTKQNDSEGEGVGRCDSSEESPAASMTTQNRSRSGCSQNASTTHLGTGGSFRVMPSFKSIQSRDDETRQSFARLTNGNGRQTVHSASEVSEADSQNREGGVWETVGDFSIHSEPQQQSTIGRTDSGSSIADISSDSTSMLSASHSAIALARRSPEVPWDPLAETPKRRSLTDSSIPTLPAPTMTRPARRSSSFGHYRHPLPLPASHIHPLESAEIAPKPSTTDPFVDPAYEINEKDIIEDDVDEDMPPRKTVQSEHYLLPVKIPHQLRQPLPNPEQLSPHSPRALHGQANSLSGTPSEDLTSPVTIHGANRPTSGPLYEPKHNRTATQATSWYAMQLQAAGPYRNSFDESRLAEVIMVQSDDSGNRATAAVTCPCFQAYTQGGSPIKISPGDINMEYLVPFQSAYCALHQRREFPHEPTLYLKRSQPMRDSKLPLQRDTGKKLIRYFALVPVIGWFCLALVATCQPGSENLIRRATKGEVKDWHWREREMAKKYATRVLVFCILLFLALCVVTICVTLVKR